MSGSAIPCTANAATNTNTGIDSLGLAVPVDYCGSKAKASPSPLSSRGESRETLEAPTPKSAPSAAGDNLDPAYDCPSITHEMQQTDVDASENSAQADHTSAAAVSAAEFEPSLLLKPFSGMPKVASVDSAPSMATPQSLQDGSTALSPLEMLIAALDPQKQAHSSQAIMTSSADALQTGQQQVSSVDKDATGPFNMLPESFWNTNLSSADGNGLAGLPWDTSKQVSEAALLNSYQLGQPQENRQYVDLSQQQQPPSAAELLGRKGSYPPGIKRPYSDFDQLLTAADMHAGSQLNNALGPTAMESSHPAKHARHASMIDCTGSLDTSAAAAAAAAAAAMAATGSNVSSTLPCSDTLSFDQQETANVQTQQALNPCFDQLAHSSASGLSLDTSIPLMSGAPLSQMQIAQSLSMSAHPQQIPYASHHSRSLSISHVDHAHGMVPPIPASLHMANSIAVSAAAAAAAAAASKSSQQNPAIGYFYDNFGSNGSSNHSVDNFMSTPMPIPSIPGVTVSPKIKPRRMSIPDVTPTAEEKRIGSKALPRRQKVRFGEDLYTPTWVRGSGQQKEGFCDTCSPGKWLQLKNSAFWYHKQFFHGISSVSGRPFIRPVQVRHYDADIIEGLCHQCQQWVPIANAKRRNSVLWFRHAHKCHVYHKPKNESEFGEYPMVDSDAAMLGMQSSIDYHQHLPSVTEQ
ncbi:hypothetical protein IWW36_002195 [Coemansia brasiliensis]|uniref:Transcription regulator Rua1 C-terminal domain-containing protein n=1 Tax=Coemansia brasiliensis TaxID=2650707 RepID=A0A9W8IGC8_9FUNG|nr:hypothetical protein IWW36_002195 [Coemansia brasiliensis]